MNVASVRLQTLELDPAAAEEWTALAERASNIFATWEWASTWWRHFGVGQRSFVTACRADGRLLGILPLYQWGTRPLRILRFIGHGPGDQLGPIHAPEDRAMVTQATAELLAQTRWNIFVGEHLPAGSGWSGALGAKILAREGSPVLHAPIGGWAAYLSTRSSNLRQQIGRRERVLAREHRVSFRLVREPEELPAALDTLFHLHGLRWPAGTSAFQPRAAFHRDFAAVALERGWLRLWLLELDGRPAAAWYGLRFANIEWYYQAGRDPALEDRSVGFVLLVHSIREALEGGVREYRFGRGHEPFKYRFADDDPGLETITLTRGVAARATLSAARSAYPRLKHRLGRWRWTIT
jgi:CelD/BcsL family acetyltransferase involved in cellulose biosynthesis